MAKKLSKLALRLRSLTVFRDLLDDPVIAALARCLERTSHGAERFAPVYGELVSRLYREGYRCAARHFEELLDFLNAEEIPPAKDKRQNSR